jgi:hypothetical protein
MLCGNASKSKLVLCVFSSTDAACGRIDTMALLEPACFELAP